MTYNTECQLSNKNNYLSIELLRYLKSNGHALRLLNFFNTQSVTSFFFSHARIAFYTRMSISSVKRALKELKRFGLIQWRRRYNKTCIYILHLSIEFKQKFSAYMKTFFAISLSFVISKERLPASDLLIKNNDFNLMVNHVVTRVNGTEVVSLDHHTIKKREKELQNRKDHGMNVHLRNDLISQLNKILPLTTHGLIKLRQYPYQAIKFALRQKNFIVKSKDPGTYLLSVCERFCKENRLSVIRSDYDRERYKLGIDKDDQQFIDLIKLADLKRTETLKREEPISRPEAYVAWRPTEKILTDQERIDSLRQAQEQLANKKEELDWYGRFVLQMV